MKNFHLLLTAIALPFCATAAEPPSRPNIVFIFCDDLGYADVGFNADLFGVKPDAVTPNIDKLAKAGTIFKQAYVAHPFCGPIRMTLLTGRMPHTYGGQKNLPDVVKKFGRLQFQRHSRKRNDDQHRSKKYGLRDGLCWKVACWFFEIMPPKHSRIR